MSLQKIDQNATYESLRLAHNETVETVTTIQTEIEEVKNSSVTPDNLPIAGESLGAVKSGGDVTIETDGTMTVNDNSHNHTVENISNFPSSLPASDVHEWAKAESKPTYTASEVGADAVGSANTALESAKAYTDELANGAVATNTAAIEAINNAETGILAQAKAYVDTQDAANKEYVDGKIDSVIGEGASETLDTIGEISKAIEDNKDILETLNSAVGNKANSSDLTDHTGNTSNPHNVTAEQIGLGNVENKSSSEILSELTKENVTTALGYTPIETETTYSVATESNLGLVKSGGDVTVAEDGTMTVNIDAGSADTALNSAKAYTDELANGAVKTNTEAIATINDTENGILAQSKAYTDEKIDAIVGEGASETLDTIGEISKAIEDNQDILGTLNSAIGNKAESSELTSHVSNISNPHGVTAEQIGLGNVENKSSSEILNELTKENVTAALGYTPLETGTTYSVATESELGLVKSGGDITVDADGNVTVNINADPSGSADTALESAKAYTDALANGTVKSNTEAIASINDAENGILTQSKAYTDEKINAIVGEGASETLDTIGEISKAIEDNKDILDTLNSAVGNKADSSDLTAHTNSADNPHGVTAEQIGLGNVENKSSETIRGELTKENITTALGYTPSESDTTYSAATSSELGLVQIGSNITNESGVLSITKENVTAALGYTPPETAGSAVISSSIILSADGWDGTTSNQVISVEGVTLSNIVIVSPIPSDQDAYSSSSIKCIDQGEGSLTFNCGTIPTTDITVNVVIL